jgi:hypothetical protein
MCRQSRTDKAPGVAVREGEGLAYPRPVELSLCSGADLAPVDARAQGSRCIRLADRRKREMTLT